jgi:hypothetical protein
MLFISARDWTMNSHVESKPSNTSIILSEKLGKIADVRSIHTYDVVVIIESISNS